MRLKKKKKKKNAEIDAFWTQYGRSPLLCTKWRVYYDGVERVSPLMCVNNRRNNNDNENNNYNAVRAGSVPCIFEFDLRRACFVGRGPLVRLVSRAIRFIHVRFVHWYAADHSGNLSRRCHRRKYLPIARPKKKKLTKSKRCRVFRNNNNRLLICHKLFVYRSRVSARIGPRDDGEHFWFTRLVFR